MFTCKGSLRKRLSDGNFTSKTGNPYRLGEYLFDLEGERAPFIHFKVFGDINETLVEGNIYEAIIEVSSREYNGRYYTDIVLKGATLIEGQVEKPSVVDDWGAEAAADPTCNTGIASGVPQTDAEKLLMPSVGKDDLPF